MSAISIKNLSKCFPSLGKQAFFALKGISLEIKEGEFFGLLGSNGAGKTTLINIVGGLSRADAGEVLVCNHDVVKDYRSARRSLGIVPQELVFDPFLTVRETLGFQRGYYGLKPDEAWIDELLTQLHLNEKADANMRSLSGGMKRRVMVAQALVHKPPVLILDEPTAGVDVALRQNLWKFIRSLNKKGHTIVLTTHYLEEAEELCGRIAMLKQGEVIVVDTMPNLVNKLANTRLSVTTTDGRYPTSPTPLAVAEGSAHYAINHYHEIEEILRSIREAGHTLSRVNLEETDLEEIFLQLA